MNIRFIVMGFASHKTWAEGYQRATTKHNVYIDIVPGDRWKFRMLVAAAEIMEMIKLDDDVVVVDGMFDVTVLVALLKSQSRPKIPKVLVYLHENQMTTPFTMQDRDRKNKTHWHYGMAHWRSLMVADGFVFNSQTHREAFSKALPKVINEQAPRDAVQWHVKQAQKLLEEKCTVLQYGLELDELLIQSKKRSIQDAKGDVDTTLPTILWNARLEEDKNPGAFLDMLHQVRKRNQSFKLIILGTDPSKDKKWENRIRREFTKELLFFGWCNDRTEYSQWLKNADIVISTAKHETFGISIVESVFCGALPLLPHRLSYPELFPPGEFGDKHLYSNTRGDGVEKLLVLLSLVANDPKGLTKAVERTKASIARFRWANMGSVYDHFFTVVGADEPLTLAGTKAASMLQDALFVETPLPEPANILTAPTVISDTVRLQTFIISDATDDRVALYRPKSLRNHIEYNQQLDVLQGNAVDVALHGGRRATVRMLEALSMGAQFRPISFLTTRELAISVFEPKRQQQEKWKNAPIYIADNKELLDDIRGQKLNSGDAILVILQFPISSKLSEVIANPPILILDNVRNAENIGSILRTAFCLGITSVVASTTAWAALKDSRAARCSMGTMYYHRFYKSSNLTETIKEIQVGGVQVYGVEIGPKAVPVQPHGSNRKWAAILGNEDTGLRQEVASACDSIVFVPQAHGDSLNVGHAAAITMFELGRECPVLQNDGRAACT